MNTAPASLSTSSAPASSREEDHQLMQRIASGDHDAFDAFCDRYSPLIFSTAYKVLNHAQDAEDVAHDVLLSVWQKADSYEPTKGTLVTWICTTTRNRSIDRVRSVQRRSAMHDRYESRQEIELPEAQASGRDEVFLSDARQILESAVVELSPEQREVIEMAYFEGLTQRQIADRLNSPLGTVKARIRRGLQRLQGMIRERLSGEAEVLMRGF
ncbi:MAG: sigma-70 family RNA polymerase sigma factor [Verrucomicrobiales bacterium]|nr:sigma-70 family RNA polymerase sigma factor [Verrucomicrobiales bacterium]